MLLLVHSLMKLTTSSLGFNYKAKEMNNRESNLTY